MVEDNPALLQLRLLQQLCATSGNTVVLGNTAIVPVAKREQRTVKDKEGRSNPDTPT